MDEDILSRIGTGRRREAFELLLERYQRKVFRLACSIVGNEAAAEEAAQDAFLRIWKALPAYRGEASLSTWIYTIARNTCLTHLRRLRQRAASSLEEPNVIAAAEARHAARSEREAPDWAALLAGLAPAYRQTLTLFYLQDKSYEEVSEMLGIPVGTVKTYLHRARKELAASLAGTVRRSQ